MAVVEGLKRAEPGSSCVHGWCGDWAGPAVSSAFPPSQLEKGCVSCTGISTGGRKVFIVGKEVEKNCV